MQRMERSSLLSKPKRFVAPLAALAGASGKVPTDRIIDGFDQSDLFLGKSAEGNRDEFPYFDGNELQAVRKGPWKLRFANLKNLRKWPNSIEESRRPSSITSNTISARRRTSSKKIQRLHPVFRPWQTKQNPSELRNSKGSHFLCGAETTIHPSSIEFICLDEIQFHLQEEGKSFV